MQPDGILWAPGAAPTGTSEEPFAASFSGAGGARNAQGVCVRRPRSDAHQHAAADRRGACAATDKLAYSRGTGAQVAPGDLAVACSIQEIEPLPQSLQLLLVDLRLEGLVKVTLLLRDNLRW